MLYLPLFLIIPIVWSIVTRIIFHREVTWKEFALQLFGTILVITISYITVLNYTKYDYEILNGKVLSKHSERVPCRHSYQCNCVKVGDTTVCQTCYRHRYDIDWFLKTTIGRINIKTIDSQGKKMPPNWQNITDGQHVSRLNRYANYIKASPNSLFNNYSMAVKSVPIYPLTLNNETQFFRIVDEDNTLSNEYKIDLNDSLNSFLKEIGPIKQVNLIIVFTTGQASDYSLTLRDGWLNGKKNDVVIVIDHNNKHINWVNVFSWSKNDMLNVVLRDNINNLNDITNIDKLSKIINDDIVEHFDRMSIKEFEYLKNEIKPSLLQTIILIILIIFVMLISTNIITNNNERNY